MLREALLVLVLFMGTACGSDAANKMTSAPSLSIDTAKDLAAGWWSEGAIDDASFIDSLVFLISEDFLQVESSRTTPSSGLD